MWVNPPECVFALGDTFEELLTNISYVVPNRTNSGLVEVITHEGEIDTRKAEKKRCLDEYL